MSVTSRGVRRAFSLISVAVLTACTTSSATPDATDATSTTVVATTSPSSTTTLALPLPWAPASAGEPEPDLKIAATRAVQALATYAPRGGTVDATRSRLRAFGEEPTLADSAASLLDPISAGTVEILYPQLGGLEPTEASVMVVAAFTSTTTVTRTVDIRLARTPSGWRATALASLGGDPPPASQASMAARALLDEPSVDLPDTARWDLERGFVDDRVVELLRALATEHDVRVTVFGSGHPANVFGTERISNHTAGRGVDIWAIDGRPIAELRDSPVIRAVIERALASGATEIGAPIDTDGPGGIVFTNTVHHDHLHLAFKR